MGGDLARRLGLTVRKWEWQTPEGDMLRSDGTEADHRQAMDALRQYLEERRAQRLTQVPAPVQSGPTLDAAIKDYAEIEGAALKPNTWSQRSRALDGFAETIGGHLRVGAIKDATLQHAMRVMGDWIGFYNHRRPHQALGMKTPAEAYALAA